MEATFAEDDAPPEQNCGNTEPDQNVLCEPVYKIAKPYGKRATLSDSSSSDSESEKQLAVKKIRLTKSSDSYHEIAAFSDDNQLKDFSANDVSDTEDSLDISKDSISSLSTAIVRDNSADKTFSEDYSSSSCSDDNDSEFCLDDDDLVSDSSCSNIPVADDDFEFKTPKKKKKSPSIVEKPVKKTPSIELKRGDVQSPKTKVINCGYLNCKIVDNNKSAKRSYTFKKHTWSVKAPTEEFPKFSPSAESVPWMNVNLERSMFSSVKKGEKMAAIKFWKLMFTDQMMETIVRYTNMEGRAVLKAKWCDTSPAEVEGFFGIWYLCGVQGLCDVGASELFTSEPGIGLLEAPTVMSRNRFNDLMRCMRFDDRTEREKTNPLAPIEKIFDPFIAQCKSVYSPSELITVDESICDFRGQCKFVVYMPNKPHRYGIKIWCACDAANGYLCNGKIYCGKLSVDSIKDANLSENVVLDLTKPYCTGGRTIVCDNYFTSLNLADKLYERNTYLLGTLRRGIPPEFLKEEFQEKETRFLFSAHRTMLKYQCRKKNHVCLLSTKHHQPELAEFGKGKPVMILDYNRTKGGVDTMDHMISKYKCRRISRRWPMRMLGWILDVAALNAYRLYVQNFKDDRLDFRRKFLGLLSRDLMRTAQDARINEPTNHWYTLSRQLMLKAHREVHLKRDKRTAEKSLYKTTLSGIKRMRCKCHYCPKRVKRRMVKSCSVCSNPVCKSHAVVTLICLHCSGGSDAPSSSQH